MTYVKMCKAYTDIKVEITEKDIKLIEKDTQNSLKAQVSTTTEQEEFGHQYASKHAAQILLNLLSP